MGVLLQVDHNCIVVCVQRIVWVNQALLLFNGIYDA